MRSPALLNVPLDGPGTCSGARSSRRSARARCANLSFAQFIAYGAHGVAGATASTRPSLPEAHLLQRERHSRPYPARLVQGRRRDLDRRAGGRLHGRRASSEQPVRRASWRRASPGASSTRTRRGGCTSSGKPEHGTVTAPGRARGPDRRPATLRAAGASSGEPLPRLRCTGRRCPFGLPQGAPGWSRVGRIAGLRAGQTIKLRITAPGHNGKLVRWRLPSVSHACRAGPLHPARQPGASVASAPERAQQRPSLRRRCVRQHDELAGRFVAAIRRCASIVCSSV